jgi:hypothetical protein
LNRKTIVRPQSDPAMTKLIPISILQSVKILGRDTLIADDWVVFQIFLKGGKKIYINGFGKTKLEALENFKAELATEESEEKFSWFDLLF